MYGFNWSHTHATFNSYMLCTPYYNIFTQSGQIQYVCNMVQPPPPQRQISQTFTTGRTRNNDARNFFCETCKVLCTKDDFQKHLSGNQHRKKEALKNGQCNPPSNKVTIRCQLCLVVCHDEPGYIAHINSVRHKRAVYNYKKMGKAVPSQPTVISHVLDDEQKSKLAQKLAAKSLALMSSKKKKKIAQISCMPSGCFSATQKGYKGSRNSCIKAVRAAGSAASSISTGNARSEVQDVPNNVQWLTACVGTEFIAEDYTVGQTIHYKCHLCNCTFTNVNAKLSHSKGLQHRMQYKLKVKPSLEVTISQNSRKQLFHKALPLKKRNFNAPSFCLVNKSMHPTYPKIAVQYYETFDDALLFKRYAELFWSQTQRKLLQQFVVSVEAGLKSIAGILADQLVHSNVCPGAMLKGVERVGALGKNMVLNNETDVFLVLMCTNYPTATLVNNITELLPKACPQMKNIHEQTIQFQSRADISAGIIEVFAADLIFNVKILLTSTVARPIDGTSIQIPEDGISLQACLTALAEVRRMFWYKDTFIKRNCSICSLILRIFRDFGRQMHVWSHFSDYTFELFLEHILPLNVRKMSPLVMLRFIFEAIAGGAMMSGRIPLFDPCELNKVRIMEKIPLQNRLEITMSAQHALRLIDFGQLRTILEFKFGDAQPHPEPLKTNQVQAEAAAVKRQRRVA